MFAVQRSKEVPWEEDSTLLSHVKWLYRPRQLICNPQYHDFFCMVRVDAKCGGGTIRWLLILKGSLRMPHYLNAATRRIHKWVMEWGCRIPSVESKNLRTQGFAPRSAPRSQNARRAQPSIMREWLRAVGFLCPLSKIDAPWVIVGVLVLSCLCTRTA